MNNPINSTDKNGLAYSPRGEHGLGWENVKISTGIGNTDPMIELNPDQFQSFSESPQLIIEPDPCEDKECGTWQVKYVANGVFNCQCWLECINFEGKVLKETTEIGIRSASDCNCSLEGRSCCK